MVAEKSWFGDVIQSDDIIRVGATHIPDTVGGARVGFPFVAGLACIDIFEALSVALEELVGASVSIEEIEAGPPVKQIGLGTAEHAIEACIFELVNAAAIVGMQAAVTIYENAELAAGIRIERPGVKLVRTFAADQVVVACSGKKLVEVSDVSITGIAEQPVVTAKTIEFVAALSAIHPVTAWTAAQNVVARSAIQHSDKIAATGGKSGNIDRVRASIRSARTSRGTSSPKTIVGCRVSPLQRRSPLCG